MTGRYSPPPAMEPRVGPGSRIAGYLIEEQVGAGGMAVVFRARDEALGRLAAVKVLSPALAADQDFRARFERERRLLASVDEPHILPVYGAGEENGVLYIATRFVSGGDLVRAMQVAGGPLQPARVASLVSQVAAALDAAHAVGLVHRDVKPGNVLIDNVPGRAEQAYLSDFGLSKATNSATELTAAGVVMGTPDYCPPEQFTSQYPISPRSDQYALACLAFALLTGTVPYQRPDAVSAFLAHVQEPVPSLSARRPTLPAAADAVVARGMAKEPAGRYSSCGELAAALQAALSQPQAPAAAFPQQAAVPFAAAAPQSGYGAPQSGYGAPQSGYGAPQAGYGAPQPGYAAQPSPVPPPPGYAAQPSPVPQPGGYAAQPSPVPQPPGYAAQPPPVPGYGATAAQAGYPASAAASYQAPPSNVGYPGTGYLPPSGAWGPSLPAPRNRRTALIAAGGVIAAVIVVTVALVLATSGGGNPGGGGGSAGGGSATGSATSGSAGTSLATEVTTVPASTLDAVGDGGNTPGGALTATSASSPLTSGGKPEVFYDSAEYCPYCASESWGLIVALSRFGTFSGLTTITSSATDTPASVPGWTFYGSSYTSSYLTFSTVETSTSVPQGSGYQPLQTPTADQQALIDQYDSQGEIPFVDFGNLYTQIGAMTGLEPASLTGSWPDIAGSLKDPSSANAQAVDGAANWITAVICKLTGNQPGAACTSVVQSLEQKLPQ